VLPRQLPAPTGPYRVGPGRLRLDDTGRTDPLARARPLARPLGLGVVPRAGRRLRAVGNRTRPATGRGCFQFGILANRLDGLRTHSVDGAPVADGRFPLVVLEPGWAWPRRSSAARRGPRQPRLRVAGVTPTYSANVTVLHGHTVRSTPAGNPQDFSQASGDRRVPVWAADARFRRRPDGRHRRAPGRSRRRSRVVYIGHSFGGAASLQACHDDRRCGRAVTWTAPRSAPFSPPAWQRR